MRSVEETLPWIREVNQKLDTVENDITNLSNVTEARRLFHSTEDFFNDLSYQNMEILNLISEGGALMSKLPQHESRNLQTNLITLKRDWQEVRNRASRVQNDVQGALMNHERGEIESMGDCMTEIEDRIDKITQIPGSYDLVKNHVAELHGIQDLLHSYQPRINNLGSAVILVDESESESYQDLEEELNLLGNRWAKICKWTEQRWDLLHLISRKWQEFHRLNETFSHWLKSQTEKVDELIQNSWKSEISVTQARDYFKHLKSLESIMETKQDEFSNLGDVSAELCKYNENEESFEDVQSSIIALAEKWDCLVQKMEDLGEYLGKNALFSTKVTETSLPQDRMTQLVKDVITTETVEDDLQNDIPSSMQLKMMNEFSENAVKLAYDLAVKELESSFTENGNLIDFDEELEAVIKDDNKDDVLKEAEVVYSGIEAVEKIEYQAVCPEVDRGFELLTQQSVDTNFNESDVSSLEAMKVLQSSRATSLDTINEPGTTGNENMEKKVEQMKSWLDKMNSEINSLCRVANTSKSLKATIEDMFENFSAKEIEFDWLPNTAEVEDLRGQFNALKGTIKTKEDQIITTLAQKQILSDLEILERIANETSEWINSQEPIGIEQGKIKLQLDLCQGKYWEIQKHRQKLTALEEKDVEFLQKNKANVDALTLKSIMSRLKHLKSSLDKSMLWLENRDKRLTTSLDNTPPQKYSDSLSELTTFLAELKTKAESMGSHVVCDIATMEDNVQTCKKLRMKSMELVPAYEYFKNSFIEISQKCTDQSKLEFLRTQNGELCDKWVRYTRKMDDKTAHLEKWLKVFRKFNEEVGGLNTWMDQVYMFLHSEEAALGDVATVSAQYEQSKALEDDISTIKPNLVTILEIGQQLIDRSSPKYGRKLRSSLDTLQKKWDKTVKLTKQQINMLEIALEKSRLLENSLVELRAFLEEMDKTKLSRENLQVKSLDEIPAILAEYSRIKEAIDNHEHLVKKIDSVYCEIVKQDLLDGLEDLMSRVNTVNSAWSTLKTHVHETYDSLSTASQDFQLLQGKIDKRCDWLLDVENVFERTPKLVVGDAEDLSEQLDSLEKVLDESPEAESMNEIEEIAMRLQNSGVLVSEVTENMKKLKTLGESVEKPARVLRETMLKNLKNVQIIEADIIATQAWITDTDASIQQYLDSGMFAENVKDQFEVILREMSEKETKIQEISQQFAQMTLNSAERIQQQINLLRKDIEQLNVKMVKFQKPANFETKRQKVINKMNMVAHALECAEIKDWNEDYLQVYLEDHEKQYNELSNLKPDVEYVLKTGYSVIEKQQIEEIEQLESSLCDIKNQFNELGAKVTAGKGMFESAMKFSRRISANYIELMDWMEQTEKELEKSGALAMTVDDLLYDLQLHEKEMKNVLHDTDELLDLAEPHPLVSLEQMIEATNQRFKLLAVKIAETVSNTVERDMETSVAVSPGAQIDSGLHSSAAPSVAKSFSSSVESGSEGNPGNTTTWYGLINEIRKWLIVADKELLNVEKKKGTDINDADTKAAYEKLKKELKEQEVKKRGLKAMALEAKNAGDTRIDEELKCFNSQFNNVSLRIHTAKETEVKIAFVDKILGPFTGRVASPKTDGDEETFEASKASNDLAQPSAGSNPAGGGDSRGSINQKKDLMPQAMAMAHEHLEVEQELANMRIASETLSKYCQIILAEDETASFRSNSSNSSSADEQEQSQFKVDPNLKNIERLDHQWTQTEPRVKDLLCRGFALAAGIGKTNPSKSKNLREKLEKFKTEWEEIKRQKNFVMERQWYGFKREVQHFEIYLFEIERKTTQTKGNLQKLKAIYSDYLQLRQDFACINFRSRDLMSSGNAQEVIQLMAKLIQKWKLVETYFEWFDPADYSAALEGGESSKANKNIVKEFMVEAYPTMGAIGEMEQELQSTDLFLTDCSNLGNQITLLQTISTKISNMQTEMRNLEALKQSYLECCSSDFEGKEIERAFMRIKVDWTNVRKSFDEKKELFDHCLNEIQVLSDFLKVLAAWVTKAEAVFDNTRLASGKINIQKAQNEQLVLENELHANLQVFDSLKSRYAQLAKMSNTLNTSFLKEKISTFEKRWTIVEEEINNRHQYLRDFQPTMEKFLKEIDSILAWVNKVNDFLTRRPPNDQNLEKMKVYQQELKGCLKDLESMNGRIQDVNEMGQQLISNNPTDLELIECKLRELNPRYVNVSHAVLRANQEVDILMQVSEEFAKALDALENWILQVKKVLDDPTSISDFSTVAELRTELKDKSQYINVLGNYNTTHDLECFKERATQVMEDYNAISHRINHSQPSNIELESILRQSKKSYEEKHSNKSAARTTASHSMSGHQKFDSTVEEIRDWLIILQHLLKSEMVTVGDVNHIKNLITKQKQILNEPLSIDEQQQTVVLGSDIPLDEGDELTKCLSGIQNGLQSVQGYLLELSESIPLGDECLAGGGLGDATGLGNQDPGSKFSILTQLESIKRDWEECRGHVIDRCRHLEILLQASETFLNIYDNCRNDLCNAEYKLTHFGKIGYSTKVLKRQIASQKVLKDEMKVLRKTVEALVRLANKIISDFSQDNTTRVREMRDSIYGNWKRVVKLSEDLDTEIRKNLQEVESLTRNAEDLFHWMQEIELQIDVLALEISSSDLVDNEVQYFQWQVQCKEFQLEIAKHRGVWHAVEVGCQKGRCIKGLKLQDEFDISIQTLDELTIKWNSIKQKVKQIRQKLNINMEHCKQLISALTELNIWVCDYLKTLKDNPADVSGSLAHVQAMYDKFIIDRSHISKKQKMVEANIDLGRQYVLELEDTYSRVAADLELYADRRGSIVSTASDDSPENVKEVVNNINNRIKDLNRNWEELTKKLEILGKEISQMMKKYQIFNSSLDNLYKKVHEADNLRYRWKNFDLITVEIVPEELEVMKNFETHLRALKENLDCLNTESKKLKIALEEKNKLLTCNAKWNEVEAATESRKTKLKKLLNEFGPNSQAHLANSVSAPWERTVAPNKVPFYINHKTESTQWDHPKYTDFMDSLAELNGVRFSAYRTAMKLTKLEAFLSFEAIDLQQVTTALDKQDFKKADVGSFIDVADIINCLNSLFQVVVTKKKNQVKLSLLVDLALNFILNVYDAPRNGKIRILSLKTLLATLCRSNLEDKYKYLFKLVCGPLPTSTSCTSADLGRLLHDIMQIPKQLGEIASFGGSNIEPSVKSCLSLSKTKNNIDLETFLEWMKCEPQSLVWLPVLFRMQSAETAKHQAKCNICKAFPIVGFRYRCLKCFNFDMCQVCFLAGKSHKSHKLSHPMQEYCSACNTSEDVKALAKVFKNRFAMFLTSFKLLDFPS